MCSLWTLCLSHQCDSVCSSAYSSVSTSQVFLCHRHQTHKSEASWADAGSDFPGKTGLCLRPNVEVKIPQPWQKQAQMAASSHHPSCQAIQEGSSGHGADPAAVRGLVDLGRWSYCLSTHDVKNVRNWVRGSQRGLRGRGLETKTGPDGCHCTF